MDTVVDVQPEIGKEKSSSEISMKRTVDKEAKKKRRGRPKGARTTSLTEVRKQAAEERKKIKNELGGVIAGLQSELLELKQQYIQETGRLNDELE